MTGQSNKIPKLNVLLCYKEILKKLIYYKIYTIIVIFYYIKIPARLFNDNLFITVAPTHPLINPVYAIDHRIDPNMRKGEEEEEYWVLFLYDSVVDSKITFRDVRYLGYVKNNLF